MGILILVRHGESEANRDRCFSVSEDVPLTELGRRQARELALRIGERFTPSRLLSSEFLRARQTAEIVGLSLGLSVEVVEGIHERDFGCLRGFPYDRAGELTERDPAYDSAKEWLWAPEGGESCEDVRQRVMIALSGMPLRYPDEEVVIVCHGIVMVSVWAHLTGGWEAGGLKGVPVPSNCGIVVLEHEKGHFGQPYYVEDCAVAPSTHDESEASVQPRPEARLTEMPLSP